MSEINSYIIIAFLRRDYLFKCVDNSETISADAYGERHLAVPLRDYEGWAIVVIDINMIEVKELPRIESREVMKMLRLVQMAYKEIFREATEGEKNYMLGMYFIYTFSFHRNSILWLFTLIYLFLV